MPVFRLNSKLMFPSPRLTDENGLLAIGGDLSTERLLLAYSSGIFPWGTENKEVLWWSPDPRCVLFPEKLRISRRLARRLRKNDFVVTFDKRFGEVILNCAAAPRRGQRGTWITKDFIKAYGELHKLGYAHSVEVMMDGMLAGGLYGVSIGRTFSGESMFSFKPDASKIALFYLVQRLREWRFPLIDCQIANPYLLSMGAEEIPRAEFLKHLEKEANQDGYCGSWEVLHPAGRM